MKMRTQWIVAGLLVLTTMLAAPAFVRLQLAAGSAHPLHTSLAELVYEPASRTFRVMLRVFVDDFATASLANGRTRTARGGVGSAGRGSTRSTENVASAEAPQSPYLAYVRSTFLVADARGRQISLVFCGWTRAGDLVWLCFRGSAPNGLEGFFVTSHLLFDLYDDQINIVQASYGGRKSTLLFTPGDRAKAIP